MQLQYKELNLRQIYVLTDDPRIAQDVTAGRHMHGAGLASNHSRSRLPALEVVMQPMEREKYDGPENQNEFVDQMGTKALTELMVDIHAASTCKAFVGTSSSGIGRPSF